MDLREKRTGTNYVFKGRILNLRVDDIITPGGDAAKREIVEHRGGAGIVAVDENKMILLVEQYRAPYDEITLEIPAGKLEEGEDPALLCRTRAFRRNWRHGRKNCPVRECLPIAGIHE